VLLARWYKAPDNTHRQALFMLCCAISAVKELCCAVACCPAVLYPKAPLLDATTGRLTTPCVKALLRIFLMCDIDGVRGSHTA